MVPGFAWVVPGCSDYKAKQASQPASQAGSKLWGDVGFRQFQEASRAQHHLRTLRLGTGR